MKRKILKRKTMFYPSPREALIWALGFVVFYSVYWLGMQLFYHSNFFTVQKLHVSGNHYLERGQVEEIAGISKNQTMFQLNTSAVTDSLMANRYIRTASVARALPATIRIDINERIPVCYMVDKSVYMVDEDGVMLEKLPRMSVGNLPLITGLSVAELQEEPAPLLEAIQLVQKMREVDEKLLAFISEINIAKERWPELYLVRGGALVCLGGSHYYERLFLLSELLSKKPIDEALPQIKRIDLTFNNRIIVQKKS